MARARSQQISLESTPYYHCVARCVRRAYLCGEDPVSGHNFDHRKRWIVERFKELSAVFAVDICAYAVMSNHYHLVLHVDQNSAEAWSDDEVIKRWTTLFPTNGRLVETLYLNKQSRAAERQLQLRVKAWRERLTDISWFMRCLNEFVARRANREDECSGRFWEGRFKSQALLDEKALVTCMAYVDLNPVRAGMTDALDSSDFTSIQERLIAHAKKVKKRNYRQHRLLTRRSAKHLLGTQSSGKKYALKSLSGMPGFEDSHLPVTQQNYFELLETTCKAVGLVRTEKNKAVHLLREKRVVLEDLHVGAESWLRSVMDFNKHYALAAGAENSLIQFHRSRVRNGVKFKHADKWIRGLKSAKLLYGT